VLSPLPRVTEHTRRQLLKEIDEKGPFEFTRTAVAELGQSNPELLQAVHHFASGWAITCRRCHVDISDGIDGRQGTFRAGNRYFGTGVMRVGKALMPTVSRELRRNHRERLLNK
jgi:hypothetical protein